MSSLFKFKICVVGDYSVGKTSLINRFVKNTFQSNYMPTLGANLLRKEYEEEDGTKIKLILWDIAGQELFHQARKQFYINAQGVFYVYDVTREESFTSIRNWKTEIVNTIQEDHEEILVANKMDLEPVVSSEEGRKLAEELGMDFIETSAKTDMNVEKAFHQLAQSLVKQKRRIG
ncbi:MAG: Rab family GTPase [Candidatus Helarchaeota archaeon]